MRAHLPQTARTPFPPAVLPASMLLFLFAGMGQNSLLAAGAILTLVVGSALLWRPGESPILLFILALQWLQASVSIFHANAFGIPVNDLSELGGDLELATTLSLLGILVVSIGMRLGAGAARPIDAQAVRARMRFTPQKAIKLYAAAWIVSSFALSCAWVIPGLSQPFLALAQLKWAFFFILTYVTFARPDAGKLYWLIAFLVEFAMALGGFFSDFKTVFFFSAFGLLAAGVRLSTGRIVGIAVLGAFAFASMIVWTAIKGDYRAFVNGGEKTQMVTVDYLTGMGKIGDLIVSLDNEKLTNAVNNFLLRTAYVEFFSLVLNYVPQTLPHERGALWMDAISRPFMPRLFFPSKTAIDDSERTVKYTGYEVAGAEQGTSISIGYVGESYIDFGKYLMMVMLLVYGYAIGVLYRWLLNHRNARGLLGMGLASAVLFMAGTLEASITKVFGSIIVSLLVATLIIYFLVPRYPNWLRI